MCWGGLQWDSGLVSSRERAPLWDGAGGTGGCVDSVAISTQPYRWQSPHLCNRPESLAAVCQAERPWGENECRTTMSRYSESAPGQGPNSSKFLAAREAGKGPPNCASRRVSDENAWSVCWAGLRRCSACCAWQSPAGPGRLSGPVSGRAGPGSRISAVAEGNGRFARQCCCAAAATATESVFWPDSRARITKRRTQICDVRSFFHFPFFFLFSRWSLACRVLGQRSLQCLAPSVAEWKPTFCWMAQGRKKGRRHPAKSHGFRLSSLTCGQKQPGTLGTVASTRRNTGSIVRVRHCLAHG